MEYEKLNEDQLLILVYAKLAELDIDKWDFKEENDAHFYATRAGKLRVKVGGYFEQQVLFNYMLKISDGKGRQLYQILGGNSSLSNLYEILEDKRRKKIDAENKGRKKCAPLEQLLAALENPGKTK